MQGYCDVHKWTILNRTSLEVRCLHQTSSRREMCTSSVRNVFYHIFSHGTAFYTLNGKNVNVTLESVDNVVSKNHMTRTFNNTFAWTRNVIKTSVPTMRFVIEIMFILKAIKSHFKGSYDKQNLTLVAISYEICDTCRKLVL